MRAGGYDIVFCRNLLIYFDETTTATAIAKLRLVLADDGMLFAGYAEVPAFCRHGFAPLRMPGAFALQKERRAEARQPPPAVAPVPRPARAPAPAVAATPRIPLAPPRETAPLVDQAARLAGAGDYAGAARICHALLKDDPAAAEAYFILGLVSECEKKPGAAADYWRRCIYLQPDHYEALCHLALLAEQNGDSAQAISFKQRAARVYQRRTGQETRKQAL